MKYASIDMGTNTVLLSIVDERGGRLDDLLDISTITRLGEGLKETGLLSQTAMDRSFSALKRYRDTARRHEVNEILCVATAAMREAGNSHVFMKRVKDELGISIRVITSGEEAYYTYLSVKHDGFPGTDRLAIVDIGGGSTEIILGDRTDFIDSVSLPVGSVKLTEMFIKNDPPTDGEIENLTGFLRETVKSPFDAGGCTIVGTAGTVTNLASLVLGLEVYEKRKIHGLLVKTADIDRVIGRLRCLTVEERKKVKGMEPGREDILLQGIILMREIMTYLDGKELVVSANGVRYGVLYERLGRGTEATV